MAAGFIARWNEGPEILGVRESGKSAVDGDIGVSPRSGKEAMWKR